MAITITATPDTFDFLGRPQEFNVTSDRTSGISKTVFNTTDNGSGKVRFTFSSSHVMQVGDIVTGTFTNTALSVRHTVTAVTSLTLDTDLDYIAAFSGQTGSILRTNDNFKIKAEIKKSTTVLATLYSFPISSTFKFDIQAIVSSEINSEGATDLPVISSVFEIRNTSEGLLSYTVVFTEVYDDVDGLTSEHDTITSSVYNVINASFEYKETQSLSNYILSAASTTAKLLTNIPSLTLVHAEDFIYIFFIYNGAKQVKAKRSIIGGIFADVFTPLVTVTNKLGVIKVGTAAMSSSTNAVSIAISLYDATNVQISEGLIFKFQKTEKCGSRVLFRNKLGGYDAVTILGEEERKNKVDKAYYKKNLEKGYSLGARGFIALSKSNEKTMKVTTDYLSKEQLNWLDELNESEDVYLIEDNNYIPIHATGTQGYLESSKLKRLTLSCILPTNK